MHTAPLSKFKVVTKELTKTIEAEAWMVHDGILCFYKAQGKYDSLIFPKLLIFAVALQALIVFEQLPEETQ